MSAAPDGPFDAQSWPDVLTARVVTPGAQPRLHGYDCEGELAPGARMAERILLALTGELPTVERARAFDAAMGFVEPISVAEAPSHAAVLARLCSGSTSSILATAALALAEQARFVVETLAPHWARLVSADEAPHALLARGDEERASVDRLRRAMKTMRLTVPALRHDLARTPAIVSCLVACGLTEPDQVQCAWVQARLPVAFAEAMAEKPANLRSYPWDVPSFRYEEGGAR